MPRAIQAGSLCPLSLTLQDLLFPHVLSRNENGLLPILGKQGLESDPSLGAGGLGS